VLHTLLWKNQSPNGGDKPTGELAAAIDGSGWGLAWEPLGERWYVAQIYDHQDNIGQSSGPLLMLDAWEHASYLQYQNKRPDCVEALWNIIDWRDVSAKFERARGNTIE
jgi:Fe-Mn family superoxide dismutase